MKMWIARDKDNTLTVYDTKPKLYFDEYWDGDYYTQNIILNEKMFLEVTFENSPMEVELVIKK